MVTARAGRGYKLCHMRTYSHAILTYAVARLLRRSEPGPAAWASLGAVAPDVPAISGAAWLAARRLGPFSRERFEGEVCGRGLFRAPDAALHSALPVAAALAVCGALGERSGVAPLAFTLGWAGHVAADALTHGEDARPLFWPLSGWRFVSPVSYRERERHARAFAIAEHAAVVTASVATLAAAWSGPRRG
jgi:hypothetical protein